MPEPESQISKTLIGEAGFLIEHNSARMRSLSWRPTMPAEDFVCRTKQLFVNSSVFYAFCKFLMVVSAEDYDTTGSMNQPLFVRLILIGSRCTDFETKIRVVPQCSSTHDDLTPSLCPSMGLLARCLTVTRQTGGAPMCMTVTSAPNYPPSPLMSISSDLEMLPSSCISSRLTPATFR